MLTIISCKTYSEDDKKNFAAMFSIKEYREVSIASLDKFLQIPQEFIITQSK